MKRILSGFVIGAFAAFAVPAGAQAPAAAPPAAAAPAAPKKMDPKYVYQLVGARTTTKGVATGIVYELDKPNRTLKLKGDAATTPAFKAHKNVQNFEQLNVDDEVTVEYYRSVALYAKNPRTQPKAPEVVAALAAAPGTYQGAEDVEVQSSGTATVASVDAASNTITFKGPAGGLWPVKVDDPALLKGVAVGQEFDYDLVDATAMAVVVKPKPPPPPPPVVTAKAKIVEKKIEVTEIVYFKTGKADIDPKSFDLLNDVATILKGNPQVKKVRVEGNASKDPMSAKRKDGAEFNRKLSQERADSVKEYLVKQGVAADRIETIGFGWDRPVAPNNTKDGRLKNQRTDFTILDQ
jgi:outer membrane protein OmpA-like peptidoglycan-associated protein